MPRCINADALMEQLNRKKAEPCNKRYTEGFNDALMRFRSMVHSAPTVSPDEVRDNGNWYDVCVWGNGAYLVVSMRCSICNRYHNEVYHYRDPIKTARYCPNCGAKMEVSE